MLTEIAELHGLVVFEQVDGGLRYEHLSAVGGCRDPGAAVDADADVVVTRVEDIRGVDAHADLDRLASRPRFGGKVPLGLLRRSDCLGRALKRDQEGVALRVDLVAVVAANGAANDPPVVIERGRVPLCAKLG